MSENIKVKEKNKSKGDLGEKIVEKYLKENKCEILAKNFKCFYGEIDIIFKENNEIVFGEIKSRNGVKYGYPAESVTTLKRKHIFNTSKYFLYINGLFDSNIRYDVIEVYLNKKPPLINHIKSVFW